MSVLTKYLPLQTRGNGDVQDITADVQNQLSECNLADGIVTIFSPSSTSAITTIEYESGCVEDIQRLFDEIIPANRDYAHNRRWGDGNGHSHLRAALLKPSLTVPFAESQLILGTWQQIVLVDFDNRHRQRKLVLQILGE
jgi:secondary thiamine-phosphate synthase enzyme